MEKVQMKQFKIKDNSIVQKELFFEVAGIVETVADKTLEQLEREGVFVFPKLINDAQDITRDQMILKCVNDSYRSGNVMGFLGCGDERLVIESRFSSNNNDYLFQYLLERVLDFPNIINLETDANRNDKMFNLLLFLFPSYLNSALRKGVFKTYVHNEYNDGNVKGTIDVARHIKKNVPFFGNIAYNQREYAYDNSLMQLIRHTLEFIKRKPYGHKLLENVKDEVRLIVDATPSYEPKKLKSIIIENKRNTVRHAYFHEYRSLQQLCILILQNEKHQVGLGSRRIYGILFDGAWLWEEYINKLIGNMFNHPMNKAGKGAQWLFSGNNGLIYPDFISKDKRNRIIADAKYKPIENIGNKDYLQVLAYMFRFDAKQGFYLYPDSEHKNDLKMRLNSGTSYEKVEPRDDIFVVKHGLKIPKDVYSYEDFVSKIGDNEEEFKARIVEAFT